MAQKQVILGAHFPGVNNMTVWSDPQAGSQIEFCLLYTSPSPRDS
mgnify:CR=1 FL=1